MTNFKFIQSYLFMNTKLGKAYYIQPIIKSHKPKHLKKHVTTVRYNSENFCFLLCLHYYNNHQILQIIKPI